MVAQLHSIADVDTSSFEEIEKLPDFLKEKMKSSAMDRARARYRPGRRLVWSGRCNRS